MICQQITANAKVEANHLANKYAREYNRGNRTDFGVGLIRRTVSYTGERRGHMHEHKHEHEHEHQHPNAKAVSNRLAKAVGHLEKVKRMVDNGEDCSEVLIQLAAVKSAINNVGKVILIDHINHCIVDAVRENDMKKIDELSEAIRQFVK